MPHSARSVQRTIAHVMHTPVVTVLPTATLGEAALLMDRHAVSGLPVVDNNGVTVGMVTTADLTRVWCRPRVRYSAKAQFFSNMFNETDVASELLNDAYRARDLDNLQVQTIMTPTVVHVTEGVSIRQAVDLLFQHGVRRLLVTRNSHPVGIVTGTDLLRSLVKMLD